MRTRIVVAFGSALGAALTWWSAAPAAAQDEPPPPVLAPPSSGGGSIPDPREGRAPETPGDPGGWQQLTLLTVILLALVIMALLVRRQVRQAARLRAMGLPDSGPDSPAGSS